MGSDVIVASEPARARLFTVRLPSSSFHTPREPSGCGALACRNSGRRRGSVRADIFERMRQPRWRH